MTKMTSANKGLFTQVVTWVTGTLALWGAVLTIWSLAKGSAAKEYSVKDLEKDVAELKQDRVTIKDFKILQDTIYKYNIRSEKRDADIIKSHNALQKSWKLYLRDNATQLDDWIKYMNGIEFELIIPRPGETDLRMRIDKLNNGTKKDTTQKRP